MKFTYSLKKNNDFRTVYRKGRSFANKLFIMYILGNGQDKNFLGISVSKKVGNSVVRHHIKRLLKESYRLHEDMLNSGFNIVIIARPAARDEDFHSIEKAIIHLFKLHKIMKEEQ